METPAGGLPVFVVVHAIVPVHVLGFLSLRQVKRYEFARNEDPFRLRRCRGSANTMTYSLAKRLLDIGLSLVAMVLLSPVMLLTAGVVWLKIGRPVLFRQARPGLRGRPFTLFKFRTMTDQRDSGGRLCPDAVRLTPLGSFLRSSSLDELPELVNVLRGEMSLVGPRPLMMEYLPRYTAEQARRHDVLPGLTGWAQINGRNALSWEEKFRLDLWYVDHRSFWLDLRILAATVWRTLRRQGISQAGHPTMPEFTGSEKGDALHG